jgi:hypothetical protein
MFPEVLVPAMVTVREEKNVMKGSICRMAFIDS